MYAILAYGIVQHNASTYDANAKCEMVAFLVLALKQNYKKMLEYKSKKELVLSAPLPLRLLCFFAAFRLWFFGPCVRSVKFLLSLLFKHFR